jgi:hypothetical protein
MASTKVILFFFGLHIYAMAETVAVANGSKGDPYGAIAAILFGSFGLGLVTLWQRYKMALIATNAEERKQEMLRDAERQRLAMERDTASRKAETASLNERVNGQDIYIRDLEGKLREVSQEKERWKTLYEQLRPTATMTAMASPTGSVQK